MTGKVTNYEHLISLGVRRMAAAIWNYAEDCCAYCPRDREKRCDEDCRGGVRDWLLMPYIPSSDVWKEKIK